MLPDRDMVSTGKLEPKGTIDILFQLLIVPEGIGGIGTDRIMYVIDYAGYMKYRVPVLVQSPVYRLQQLRINAHFYKVPAADNLFDLEAHPEANKVSNALLDGASVYWYNYGSVFRSLVTVPMTRTYPAILYFD